MRGIGRIDLNALRRRADAQPAEAFAADAGLDATAQRSPLEDATFWLTAAAEIEHVLMVQYLFAAYSLNPASAGLQAKEVEDIKQAILQIAREEMGHLITVQNLLLLIGAPLQLGREHSPFASQIYPFRFKLEPLSLASLAKYTVAESPDLPSSQIPSLDTAAKVALFDDVIKPAALTSNDGEAIKNVGPIYARLVDTLGNRLADADFRLDRADYQARWADWGQEPKGPSALMVLVRDFPQTSAATARAAAAAAAKEIGEQGEASDLNATATESHFERFFDLYVRLQAVVTTLGRVPTWEVVEDPNTTVSDPPPAPADHVVENAMAAHDAKGRITDPRSRGWAELFNLRYRLLLQCLQHSLLRNDLPYTANGDRTPKGLLQCWTFAEMRRVKKLAEKLVQMPSGVASKNAGPPFELPFTLALPHFEPDRWRGHASAFEACLALTRSLLAGPDATDPFLAWLTKSDEQTRKTALELADSGNLPADASPKGFLKTLTILEEAMRGFVPETPKHASFWRGVGRDAFIAAKPGSTPAVVPGNATASPLHKRISLPDGNPLRMPKFRPRVPKSRIDHIRDWIVAGAPDDTPPSILLVEPDPSPEPAPH